MHRVETIGARHRKEKELLVGSVTADLATDIGWMQTLEATKYRRHNRAEGPALETQNQRDELSRAETIAPCSVC